MQRLIYSFFALLIATPASALAQVNVNTPESVRNFTSLGDLIQRVFNITVGVSGVIFVGLLLLGGVLYLTSLGNEDGVTKARKTMINAAIGLVIVVSSWAIGNFVLQLLGIRVLLNGVSSVQTPVGTVQSGTSPQTQTPISSVGSGNTQPSNQGTTSSQSTSLPKSSGGAENNPAGSNSNGSSSSGETNTNLNPLGGVKLNP